MSDTHYLDWPFFEPRHARAAARTRWLGGARTSRKTHTTTSMPNAAGWCKPWAAAAGCAMRWPAANTVAPARRSTPARCAWSARRWRGIPGWPTSPSRCRAWARAPSPCRAPPNRSSATCRAWPAARRSAPSRCRSPRPAPTSAAMQCAARIDGDHAVLDGEKTWISNGGIADFYVVFVRSGEAPGARGISAFIVDADTPGLRDRRAHRGDRAAPAGAAALHRLPHPVEPAHRRAGRGLQGGDAHARRVPHLGGGGGTRHGAPRARRGPAARHRAADVRAAAGRLPAHAGQAGADGHHHRQRRAADLPRRLAARPGAQRRPRKRRWPRWPPPKARSRSSTRRCRCSAGSAWSASSRSSGCTARSARCASTKAPPRCSS